MAENAENEGVGRGRLPARQRQGDQPAQGRPHEEGRLLRVQCSQGAEGERRVLAAINALPIRPEMTGIGSHTANLVEALAMARAPEAYVLHGPQTTLPKRAGLYPLLVTPTSPHFEQFELPNILRRLGVQVYHSPLPSCPLVRPCPAIVTVHDVIPLARPDLATQAFTRYFHAVAETCVRSADVVVTVSEFSRQQIVHFLGVAVKKIRVVHQTVARQFLEPVSDEEQSRVMAKYGLPQDYVQYVGSMEPRKNVDCLLEAVAALQGKPLVLVGRTQEGYDVEERIRRRGLGNRVRWLRYVPIGDLPALYALAGVFVFPSHYEGFGLPVLEAMSCGCPVVCSSSASLPEVAGSAALYADAGSPEEFAAQIGRVLGSRDLQDELRGRGKNRAAEFSHERYAAELLGVYEELVA